ncbi:MAG TPA: EamA family transporter [Spirochaetota bacterium]|mgnify:CR=1 FL=1|nr:EamA family transporter [Spirochaetota bacterium]HPJ34653.1 EamA family transporter [Spirochaetota bacterium]
MKKHPYILIISGAALWGLIGIFVKGLQEAGFTSMEIVVTRAISASLILFIYIALTDRALLKIKLSDIRYFIATGILSMAFFNWCYFTAIKEVSISIAVILLYTAPAFVIIISRFTFGERITKRKITALFLTVSGCILIAGPVSGAEISISVRGFIIGLGSGLGYALYPVFAKPAGKKYSPVTITVYTFFFTALSLLPLSGISNIIRHINTPSIILYSAGLGLFPTALAYILYTRGLKHVEAGNAAIVSTIEPVVAILTGFIIFGERMSLLQTGGAMLILLSLIITSLLPTKKAASGYKHYSKFRNE